uniref:hypothetical protein n=1 Tax=Pararhizobium sp. IMCC3301 TaxID=3067904 RepID=UPI0027403A8D|nr:hypothetical protein [Pararhizobium sp. IMCC3301]
MLGETVAEKGLGNKTAVLATKARFMPSARLPADTAGFPRLSTSASLERTAQHQLAVGEGSQTSARSD